jgi:xylitol oxidase
VFRIDGVLHDHHVASMTAPELNWSGTYTYAAQQFHRPGTVAELQRLVETASSSLHTLGTRHSFNDIADAAGIVSLDALPGGVRIDEDSHTVSVPATLRYGDLARHLHKAGWALSNLPSLPHISVAGSVATATHGSGNANQSLASAVTGMSLITGGGDQVRIDHTSPEFAGAVVHLGALGVVTELTLAIEPTFEVRQVVYEHLPWDQLTSSFQEVMGAGYSVSAITDFAGDDVDMLWVKSRVEDDPWAGLPDELFGARAAAEKLHVTPGNDPLHCTPQLGEPGPWYERLPHFLLEFTPSSGAEIQSEYLLDRWYASQVIEALRGLGHAIAPLVKSAEIRTVAADELWLSPAYQRDVFGVHFTWQPDAAAVSALVKSIEAALQPFHPRPHWAKVFGEGHQWSELYPRLADFRRLAEAYDPRGVFRNPYLSRTILGPSAP